MSGHATGAALLAAARAYLGPDATDADLCIAVSDRANALRQAAHARTIVASIRTHLDAVEQHVIQVETYGGCCSGCHCGCADPDRARREIDTTRQLLDEHGSQTTRTGWGVYEEICRTCRHGEGLNTYPYGACPTVLLLAKQLAPQQPRTAAPSLPNPEADFWPKDCEALIPLNNFVPPMEFGIPPMWCARTFQPNEIVRVGDEHGNRADATYIGEWPHSDGHLRRHFLIKDVETPSS